MAIGRYNDKRTKKCLHCEQAFLTDSPVKKFCSQDCKRLYPPNRRSHWNACIKSNYGITLEEYEAMLLVQQGKCAICDSSNIGVAGQINWPIDHDHNTGKVRGLICNFCNKGLGNFKDDPTLLRSAAEYLERNK